MFFFFLINGADKTNKAKCGQNKAELFPAFDSLAGKVPIRTPTFFEKPSCVVVKWCVWSWTCTRNSTFFCCSIVRTVFAFFYLALYLCDRLRVLNVRKETALVATATLSSIAMRSCLAVLKTTRQRDITTGTFMARRWLKTRGKDCQHKLEAAA